VKAFHPTDGMFDHDTGFRQVSIVFFLCWGQGGVRVDFGFSGRLVRNTNGTHPRIIRFDSLKSKIDFKELFLEPGFGRWKFAFTKRVVMNASRNGATEKENVLGGVHENQVLNRVEFFLPL
jgi:hypothetical protein